jgi:hypothetical protein
MHEIGHALVASGFQAPTNNQASIYESPFDKHTVQINGTTLGFSGDNVKFVYGTNTVLLNGTSGNDRYHLRSAEPILREDVLSGASLLTNILSSL